MEIEKRSCTGRIKEERGDDDQSKIVGYAAIFDIETQIFPGFHEKISKGAFTESIASDDIRAVFNHEPNLVLGRNTSGTLKLFEDDTGLRYEISPPDTQFARDLMELIKRQDVSQSSFAFQVITDSIVDGQNGKPDVRTLEKVKLFDISPVTFPAYTDTTVAVRNLNEWQKKKKEAVPVIYHRLLEWRRRLTLYQIKGEK